MSGWWDNSGAISGCLAAWQPIGAADLAASYVNLANPGTYDAAAGVAPTFNAATGWEFTGTQYLTTGGLDADDKPMTIIARATFTSSADYRTIIGDSIGGGGYHFYRSQTSGKMDLTKGGIAGIGSASTVASLSTDYVLAVTYSAAGAFAFYLNGAADGSGTNNQTFNASDIIIGGFGTTTYPMYGSIAALAVYGAELTSGEVATVSAAMAALPAVVAVPNALAMMGAGI